MITSWRLINFKPVRGEQGLELSKINLLAGLNSSGKSSVLQSILMVAQTLANQVLDRPLIANGDRVNLGGFFDIVNEQSGEETFGFQFSLRMDAFPSGKLLAVPRSYGSTGGLHTVDIKAVFGPRYNETEQLQRSSTGPFEINLLEGHLRAIFLENGKSSEQNVVADHPKLSLTFKRLDKNQQTEFLADLGSDSASAVPYPEGANYKGNLQDQERDYLLKMAHFLPKNFIGKYSLGKVQRELAASYAEAIIYPQRLPFLFSNLGTILPRLSIPSAVDQYNHLLTFKLYQDYIQAINGITFNWKIEKKFEGETFREFSNWVNKTGLKTSARGKFREQILEVLVDAIVFSISSEYGVAHGSILTDEIAPDQIAETVLQSITKFFTVRLRNLQAIRAEPRTVSRFSRATEPDDVGQSGEYAAAVYDANKQRIVTWWNPEQDTIEETELSVALDFWVKYLGIAAHVFAKETGAPGVSWRVRPRDEAAERMLDAVGMGVSQVLPILVAGLLAPADGALLIEQPELHLHSRAQARLADFFIGLGVVGKQCILESHSDSFVSRFRYHIVRNPKRFKPLLSMYFVEQNAAGETSFNPVEISDSGNIMNWPDGFCDEALKQEDLITHERFLGRQTHAKK